MVRPELQPLEERPLLSGYQQINLVGYQPGMAPHTDPNLNGWGMDFAPGGPFCVADTNPGVATFYDRSGQVLPQVVTIPAAPSRPLGPVGRPTGVVYNPTSDFVISENGRSAPAVFLFDSRDGTISGWNPAVDPDHAIIMVDNSTESPSRADYTGLVIAQNGQGRNVLYAADFHNNKIDMFDGAFRSVGSFTDPSVPAQYPGHTAWQVEDVGGRLWVTFASHKPGPYGGAVDIFDTDGHLLTPNHFAANAPGAGPLANPWGIVQAPADFGRFSNDILIGNVEGADIDAFDPATGAFLGALQKPDGTPIVIDGLWDLTFGGGSPDNGLDKQLFFDAGPNVPNPAGNGLFGRILAAGEPEDHAQGVNGIPAAVNPATTADVGISPLGVSPQGIVGDPAALPFRTTPSPQGSAVGSQSLRSLPNQGVTAPARPTGSLRPSSDSIGQQAPSIGGPDGQDAVLVGLPRDLLDDLFLDDLTRTLLT
jgi:uncharacterized protein (TIGR03118 family)